MAAVEAVATPDAETSMRTVHQSRMNPTCDRRVELAMRRIVLVGAVLVLAVPAARGYSPWFGALPLWLLGMPLASWWALHRFRLPQRDRPMPSTERRRRRSGVGQARRRGNPGVRPGRAPLRVA